MPAIEPFILRQPVSAATHLFWCVWSLYVWAMLWKLSGADRAKRLGVSIFGASLVLLYGASGLYHAIPAAYPAWIETFRLLDLAAIHLLIAGTCTPVFAVLLQGRTRLLVLGLVWAVALVGAVTKIVLPLPDYRVTIALYAAAGLLAAALAFPLAWGRGAGWLLGGTLIYGLGGLCEALRWPVLLPGVIGPHEILHMCDMLGTLAHVVFVARFVLMPSGPLRIK